MMSNFRSQHNEDDDSSSDIDIVNRAFCQFTNELGQMTDIY